MLMCSLEMDGDGNGGVLTLKNASAGERKKRKGRWRAGEGEKLFECPPALGLHWPGNENNKTITPSYAASGGRARGGSQERCG